MPPKKLPQISKFAFLISAKLSSAYATAYRSHQFKFHHFIILSHLGLIVIPKYPYLRFSKYLFITNEKAHAAKYKVIKDCL